jgi:hypothetical protein
MNYNDKIYGITKTCLECFGLHQNVGTLCTSCLSKKLVHIQQYFIDNEYILILVDIDVTISYIYKINSIYPDAKWQGYKQSTYVYSTYNEALLAGIEEVINILNIE